MTKLMRYNEVKEKIVNIVFPIHFAGDDTSKKIGDSMPFSNADAQLITRAIKSRFGLKLDCKVSEISTDELCNIVYNFLNNPKKQTMGPDKVPAQKKQTSPMRNHLLNSHEVFAMTLSAFGSLVGRRVLPNERINKFKFDVMNKCEKDFDQMLNKLLENVFDAPINVKVDNKMAVYNIANQVTYALVGCGKAIDPKAECANMDPLWVPIRTAMTFNTVADILWEDFGIWVSIKTISNIKSYEEFSRYITKLMIKDKINKFVFTVPNESVSRHEIGKTLIGAQEAEVITQNLEHFFNITVDYDISYTKLNKLYGYVYDKVNVSEELRNKLFNKNNKPTAPIIDTNGNSAENSTGAFVPRDEIFSDLIRNINLAVSLERSVQSYTHVLNLINFVSKDPQKVKNLLKLFHDLEDMYGITIKTDDPKLTIRHVGDAIHNYLIKQGRSKATYVALEDMDPLWATINRPMNFGFLKSILKNEYGINISKYSLSNCQTYYDYEKLVIAAQQKRLASAQQKKR